MTHFGAPIWAKLGQSSGEFRETMGDGVTDRAGAERPAPGSGHEPRRPSRWRSLRPTQIWLRAAHVVLALVGVAVLVASSTPGTGAVAMLGAVVLFWSGVVWAIVALTAWSRVRPRRRWAVLPLIVGVVALALVTQAPHRVRWAASRSAFDEVVADEAEAGLARSSVRELGRDRSLGLMDADRVYQQGEAVVFEMGEGFIFTTVGYAYLPDGPFPELKINDLGVPEFHRFDGHWYRWSASN